MKKKTIMDFIEMKKRGEKLAWITAYDAPMASRQWLHLRNRRVWT